MQAVNERHIQLITAKCTPPLTYKQSLY